VPYTTEITPEFVIGFIRLSLVAVILGCFLFLAIYRILLKDLALTENSEDVSVKAANQDLAYRVALHFVRFVNILAIAAYVWFWFNFSLVW